MGRVALARVDARLIHGQVMVTLVKSVGANAIFVADNQAAHDDFTKNILISAGSKGGQKTRVLKEDGAVRYWNDRQYDDYNVLLLTKNIKIMHDIITSGVPVDDLNIGGAPQQPGKTSVIKEVFITEEEINLLNDLSENHGVNVYFQATPSSTKVSLKEANKMFK